MIATVPAVFAAGKCPLSMTLTDIKQVVPGALSCDVIYMSLYTSYVNTSNYSSGGSPALGSFPSTNLIS